MQFYEHFFSIWIINIFKVITDTKNPHNDIGNHYKINTFITPLKNLQYFKNILIILV